MLSYQNDPAVKEMFIARFAAHRAADDLIQGTGYKNGKGCFIGCTMNNYSHESFANQIGPRWLAHLADVIFEGLENRHTGAQFGTDLLAAIPVGKDLDSVKWHLAIARHERQLVTLVDSKEDYAVSAIQQVIDYCKAELAGTATEDQRLAAESAAQSAAVGSSRSAVESARESVVWSAPRSVAWSTQSAVRSAVESVVGSSLQSAADSAALQIEANTLLQILRSL